MWIHFQEFSHDFTIFFIALHGFMIMNSYMISLSWIHLHEFKDEFIHMNSDIWFHNILHDDEFISEFILLIHIRFYDHEFICAISWPMNSFMNSCIWRILWHQYLKSCVPRFQMKKTVASNWRRQLPQTQWSIAVTWTWNSKSSKGPAADSEIKFAVSSHKLLFQVTTGAGPCSKLGSSFKTIDTVLRKTFCSRVWNWLDEKLVNLSFYEGRGHACIVSKPWIPQAVLWRLALLIMLFMSRNPALLIT